MPLQKLPSSHARSLRQKLAPASRTPPSLSPPSGSSPEQMGPRRQVFWKQHEPALQSRASLHSKTHALRGPHNSGAGQSLLSRHERPQPTGKPPSFTKPLVTHEPLVHCSSLRQSRSLRHSGRQAPARQTRGASQSDVYAQVAVPSGAPPSAAGNLPLTNSLGAAHAPCVHSCPVTQSASARHSSRHRRSFAQRSVGGQSVWYTQVDSFGSRHTLYGRSDGTHESRSPAMTQSSLVSHWMWQRRNAHTSGV
jgi:hypothetical protein